MTKEELIKLSRENLRKSKQGSLCECYDEAFIKGYELSEKQIADLEEKLANADYQLEGRDLEIKELNEKVEKMKLQYDYAFEQLLESREIICLMLSQYRNKKEIDYSTRERGEKLLKQGVYKND